MADFPEEVLEQVLKKLDNHSLFQVRSVSNIWNEESLKQLLRRDLSKEIHCLCEHTINRYFKRLEKLLQNSENKSLLIGSIKYLKLNSIWLPGINLDFQRVVSDYGSWITKLDIALTDEFKPESLSSLLMLVPNIEILSIFAYFLKVLPETSFHLPIKFAKLHDFHFKISDFQTIFPVFVDIFKEIVKSSEEIKCLTIRCCHFVVFLRAILEDSEERKGLRSLKCLALDDLCKNRAPCPFHHNKEENHEEIRKALGRIGNSLEYLAFYGHVNFGYSLLFLPNLPKLKMFLTTSNNSYKDCIDELGRSSKFPQLESVLVDYEEIECKRLSRTSDICKCIWDKDTEYVKVPLNNQSTDNSTNNSKDRKRPLKVIITCLDIGDLKGNTNWFDEIVVELSGLNFGSLFVHVGNVWHPLAENKRKLMTKCLEGSEALRTLGA